MNGILKYKIGDVTIPDQGGQRYIMQCVNLIGAYGAGVSGAIAKRWPKVEQEYRQWFRSQLNFKLGEVQFIRVQSDTVVANIIGQEGIGLDAQGKPPVRYEALTAGFEKLAKEALNDSASIIGPRIAGGLAGADWNIVEQLIIDKLIKRSLNVTIYSLE